MSRLYTVLGSLLVLGGIASLIGQAWALGAILLVLGVAVLASEFWTSRKKGYVPLEGGPDPVLEKLKAQGLQNMELGPNFHRSTNENQGQH